MEEASKLWGPSTYERYRSSDDISLKEHIDTRFTDIQFAIDARFADVQKAVDLRVAAVQIALDKAELDISKRFDDAKVYVDVRFTANQLSLDKAELELAGKLLRRQEFVDMRFSEAQRTSDAYFHDLQTTADTRFTITEASTDKAELEMIRKHEAVKAYVDTRFADLLTTMNIRFASIQTAVDKAERATNTRLEGMNEFREQLKDQASQFVTRVEFVAIQKLVYIGLGAVLSTELILKFLGK